MSQLPPGSGLLFALSAPSGTGKSTLAARLLERVPGLRFSVSYTTREPRQGEQNGREYHFVDRARFDEMVAQGAFLEWAQVFEQCYGTGLETTREILEGGTDVLLDIDVQGARQLADAPLPAVKMMLLPPDFPTLESRLRGRDSESDEIVRRRLSEARDELKRFEEFDYLVVNDDLNAATDALVSIVKAERLRPARAGERARQIMKTFPAGND